MAIGDWKLDILGIVFTRGRNVASIKVMLVVMDKEVHYFVGTIWVGLKTSISSASLTEHVIWIEEICALPCTVGSRKDSSSRNQDP